MNVIILGSGTCVPSLKRSAPAYFLEAGQSQVLVDCGSGALIQLEKAGKSYKDLDAVFITHKHPDHLSDLMPLIQALLATPDFTREKELVLFGTAPFLEYYEQVIMSVLGMPKTYPLVLKEVEPEQRYGPFVIKTTQTVHSSDSLAYRFESGGKSVVFSGDADYDPGLISLAEKADLLITDCSFPHERKVQGHMSARECGMTAHEADAATLVLSHIYPAGAPDKERVAESRAVFSGEIILAADLMELNL